MPRVRGSLNIRMPISLTQSAKKIATPYRAQLASASRPPRFSTHRPTIGRKIPRIAMPVAKPAMRQRRAFRVSSGELAQKNSIM
jgi:hypothetical protein